MKIEIVAKNYQVADALERVINTKLSRLDKYFDKPTDVRVLCKKVKETFTMEVTIFSKTIIRAEVSNIEDMYSNVDLAMDKIVRQINKHKSKLDNKHLKDFNKEKEFLISADANDKMQTVVKTKHYVLSSMTTDEAIVKLDMVGHDFYVFRDADSGEVNVLYKRKDGDFGLILTK